MAGGTRRIRLAAGSGPSFGVDDLACAAATHLGCWREAGLEVDWVPARGGVRAMSMALDGEVDAAYGGLGPVLQLRSEGRPLRVVASMARALAQNLVVREGVASPADLAGAPWAVDGIGALSHHMARCVVAALDLAPEPDWQVLGPPPERISGLLEGRVAASLIRVEEALALTRDPGNGLRLLLGFAELKELVPVQPHGVLATTEAFEAAEPEALTALVRGIVAASRRLRDDYDAFRSTYGRYVSVALPEAEIARIWRQECAAEGFAVNGELSPGHWDRQIASYAALEPSRRRVTREEVLAPGFLRAVLAGIGPRDGPDAGPGE
jgi:ABC-type nitrate/sulfonate/bicarbonate transport system substrate-binding protein